MKRFFQFLADAINGSERSILDLLSAIVPYAVPIIPAYLTFYHTRDMMGFPSWVASTAAFVVEALGITSVATAIKFWRNNQRYKTDQNKAPFKLAILVYAFYIVIVLSVNVILEMVNGTRGGWIILSIALFTLLSFPSGVLISIRAQYSEMLDDRKTARNPRVVQDDEKPSSSRKEKFASHFKPKIINMLEKEYGASGKILQPREITAKLNLDHERSKGYVSTTTTNWMKERGIERPVKDSNSPLSY